MDNRFNDIDVTTRGGDRYNCCRDGDYGSVVVVVRLKSFGPKANAMDENIDPVLTSPMCGVAKVVKLTGFTSLKKPRL